MAAEVVRFDERRRKPLDERANQKDAGYRQLWQVMENKKLSALAKSAYVVLWLKHRNHETGLCNPSLARIADGMGCCRRSAVTAIAELRMAGEIEVIGTKGGRSSNTNRYVFPPPRGADVCTPTSATPCTPRGADVCTTGVHGVAHEPSIKPSKILRAGAGGRARGGAPSAGHDAGSQPDAIAADERSEAASLVNDGGPPPEKPGDAIPAVVLGRLRQRLGDELFVSWIAKLAFVAHADGALTLSAPTKFYADRVKQDYERQLLDAWRAIFPDVAQLTVREVEP